MYKSSAETAPGKADGKVILVNNDVYHPGDYDVRLFNNGVYRDSRICGLNHSTPFIAYRPTDMLV